LREVQREIVRAGNARDKGVLKGLIADDVVWNGGPPTGFCGAPRPGHGSSSLAEEAGRHCSLAKVAVGEQPLYLVGLSGRNHNTCGLRHSGVTQHVDGDAGLVPTLAEPTRDQLCLDWIIDPIDGLAARAKTQSTA
jgi:hypothetical protein